MQEYRVAHYADLPRAQREQAVRLLSYEHMHKVLPAGHPVYAISPGTAPVALLRGEKVLAALVTDGQMHVSNWAGHMDRQFKKEYGHTPAEELMRHHLALTRGKLTYYGKMTDEAATAFERRILDNGGSKPVASGDIRMLTVPPELLAEMFPRVPINEKMHRVLS